MFCVVNGNLTGVQAAARYLDNLDAIAQAARAPGPFIYGVYADRVEQLHLY